MVRVGYEHDWFRGIAVTLGATFRLYESLRVKSSGNDRFRSEGSTPWSSVIPYTIAQMLRAFLGAVLVWVQYRTTF